MLWIRKDGDKINLKITYDSPLTQELEMEASPDEGSFRQVYQKHANEDGKLRAKELKAFILELSRTGIHWC